MVSELIFFNETLAHAGHPKLHLKIFISLKISSTFNYCPWMTKLVHRARLSVIHLVLRNHNLIPYRNTVGLATDHYNYKGDVEN